MEINQIWEVRYKVSPTLSKSEEFAGYSFEVFNNEIYVTRIYEKIVILDEKRIKSKLVKKVPPQNEIKNDQQAIRNILLKRMIYTGSFSEITVEPEFYLKNQQELEDLGFRLTTQIESVLHQPFSLLAVENDYLSSCDRFWNSGFEGKLKGLEETVLFISDWIEKSVVEKQPIQSFMLLWVAFNCMYDTFSRETKLTNSQDTFEKINKTIGKLLKEPDISNILKNHQNELFALASFHLMIPRRNGQTKDTPISSQLNRMLEENAPSDVILCKSMRCIYEIRNNVFHQGSLNTNIERQASVAKTLLLSVTAQMLRNMICFENNLIKEKSLQYQNTT